MTDTTGNQPQTDVTEEYCRIVRFVPSGRKAPAKSLTGRLAPYQCKCGRKFAKLNFRANGDVWVPPHKLDTADAE